MSVDRAWTWRGGSEPGALVLEERPLPAPGHGEVLVRLDAIGLNPVDWKLIGRAETAWQPGHVPGVDGAGEVVALGSAVDQAWLGRAVAFHGDLRRSGSFAEHVVVPVRALLRRPHGMESMRAAGLPCPALTALIAVDKLPAARPHGSLLLSGAGSAVGNYALQMATGRGWRVTTISHPRHHDRLRGLGAITCLSDVPSPGSGFHAAIDTVGPDRAAQLAPALGANGHLVTIGGRLSGWPDPAFTRTISLHEVALGALHAHGTDEDWADLTAAGERLLGGVMADALVAEPIVEASFAELPRLLGALKARDFTGKPVVRAG